MSRALLQCVWRKARAGEVNFARFLKPELVELNLTIEYEPPAEGVVFSPEHERWKQKELVLKELASVFERSGEVRNATRFFKDFVFREKQASTGVGHGIAIPHLRSLQARKVVTMFARSEAGVEFENADGKTTHLFFGIAAPPYDDAQFLQIFQWIARAFTEEEWLFDALMSADTPDETIYILRGIG